MTTCSQVTCVCQRALITVWYQLKAHATFYFASFLTICLSSVVSEIYRFIGRKFACFRCFHPPYSLTKRW